jgi:hypothetical protein
MNCSFSVTPNPWEFRLCAGSVDTVSADTVHGVATGVRASPAPFSADQAMFVPFAVTLALLVANFTGGGAKF